MGRTGTPANIICPLTTVGNWNTVPDLLMAGEVVSLPDAFFSVPSLSLASFLPVSVAEPTASPLLVGMGLNVLQNVMLGITCAKQTRFLLCV